MLDDHHCVWIECLSVVFVPLQMNSFCCQASTFYNDTKYDLHLCLRFQQPQVIQKSTSAKINFPKPHDKFEKHLQVDRFPGWDGSATLLVNTQGNDYPFRIVGPKFQLEDASGRFLEFKCDNRDIFVLSAGKFEKGRRVVEKEIWRDTWMPV
jgi:hypothetical protein